MRRVLGMVAVVVVLPAVALADGFRDGEAMNELLLSSGAEHVHATPGSGCISEEHPDGTGTSTCVDTVADLPLEGRLELLEEQPLRFELDHPAVSLDVSLRGSDEEIDPKPADGKLPATVWEAEVPIGLRGDYRLDALARYDEQANPTGDRAFQAAVSGVGPPRAPKRARAAARARAVERLGGRPEVTFSVRSERARRWALVTGERRKRIWAAWVRRGEEGRWRVRIFRTRNFDPPRVPCDLRPAFSEPSC